MPLLLNQSPIFCFLETKAAGLFSFASGISCEPLSKSPVDPEGETLHFSMSWTPSKLYLFLNSKNNSFTA